MSGIEERYVVVEEEEETRKHGAWYGNGFANLPSDDSSVADMEGKHNVGNIVEEFKVDKMALKATYELHKMPKRI